jgi:hypothetical protein
MARPEPGILKTLLALDIAQLTRAGPPHQQIRHMARGLIVLYVAQPQRLLADPLDLPVESINSIQSRSNRLSYSRNLPAVMENLRPGICR